MLWDHLETGCRSTVQDLRPGNLDFLLLSVIGSAVEDAWCRLSGIGTLRPSSCAEGSSGVGERGIDRAQQQSWTSWRSCTTRRGPAVTMLRDLELGPARAEIQAVQPHLPCSELRSFAKGQSRQNPEDSSELCPCPAWPQFPVCRQSMKFDALCDFVEDELVEIKRRLMLARSLDRERPRQGKCEPNEGRFAIVGSWLSSCSICSFGS